MQISDKNQRLEMGKSIRDIYTGGEPFGDRLGDGIRVKIILHYNNTF